MTPKEWRKSFPNAFKAPNGERHDRLWGWFDALEPGVKPPAQIEIWGRGGAKSQSAESCTAFVGEKGTRTYVLYVSGTQDQADKHVASIATMLAKRGIDRALNKYGNSKGWRRNQLRAANGFNVEALGLDTAARGIKLDEFRPDLIILDDIDEREDTPERTEKKIRAISQTIIPAGSADCAVLFIQNLIIEDGIAAQLMEDRADFLLDRNTPEIEPAVRGLVWEQYINERGKSLYRITGGVPTWEGQSLKTCEKQINEWGLRSFLREAQHEVKGADGYFFNVEAFRTVPTLPNGGAGMRFCRAWDLAATQGGGDYTSGNLHAWETATGIEYVVNVVRAQLSSGNVRKLICEQAARDVEKYGTVTYHLAQDPGQAGKDQAEQMEAMLADLKRELDALGIRGLKVKIEPVTGRKGVRSRGWAKQVEDGNAVYCEDTMAEGIRVDGTGYVRCKLDGIFEHKEEHRKFREDEQHKFDDQVDGSADAHNELAQCRGPLKGATAHRN